MFNLKVEGSTNNPENSLTTKLCDHIPYEYSMSTIRTFNHVENNHTLYHGKDCMKSFCKSLREDAEIYN